MVWDPLKEQGRKKKKTKTKSWFEKKMVELEFLRLEFYVEFFPHQMPSLASRVLKTRVSTIELEFLKLKMLIFQFVLQHDN